MQSHLNCPKFGYDAGDCTCAPGEIRDCNGACRASQDIGFELGDGKCDVFTVLGDSNGVSGVKNSVSTRGIVC